MKKILISLAAIVLVSALILGGCGEKETGTTTPVATTAPATQTPKYGGTFRLADAVTPLDSGIGWFAEPRTYKGDESSCMFYDRLLKEYYNGDMVPNLATKWEIAPDLKSVTFTLREGVKFHDGSDFNAEAAAWNINQMIDAQVSPTRGWISAEAVSPYVVRLNMDKFVNTMYEGLGALNMVSKAAYDAHGGANGGADYLKWHPVGTGPFKFVSYEPGVSVKGVRNENYWQKGKPYLDAVEMYYIADPMTRAAAFEAGEMDAAGGELGRTEYELQQKGYKVALAETHIAFLIPDAGNADSPLANLKVRQAVDYAIDRDAIVNAFGYGFLKATPQVAYPGTPCYITDLAVRAYNPDKARQLLAEAGYPNGFDTKIFGTTAMGSNSEIATAIQGHLSKVGIRAEVQMLDVGTWMDYSTKGWKNGFTYNCWSFPIFNPNFSHSMWNNKAPFNVSGLFSDELNKLVADAADTRDYEPAMTQKIVQWFYDNLAMIPLYTLSRGDVLQPYVHDDGFATYSWCHYFDAADIWLSK